MIALAIETATTAVGVALVGDEGLLAALSIGTGAHQAETLHPAMVSLLDASGLGLGDLGGIVVDVGPGLFTGLRVGVAAAKALALGLGLPVIGVESTAVLIEAATLHPGEVLAVVDLRRGDLAVALRSAAAAGASGGPAELSSPEALGAMLAKRGNLEELVIVGDGLSRQRARLEDAYGAPLPPVRPEFRAPSPSLLGTLGVQALARGEGGDPLALAAHYLKGAEVRINWTTRPLAGAPAPVVR